MQLDLIETWLLMSAILKLFLKLSIDYEDVRTILKYEDLTALCNKLRESSDLVLEQIKLSKNWKLRK